MPEPQQPAKLRSGLFHKPLDRIERAALLLSLPALLALQFFLTSDLIRQAPIAVGWLIVNLLWDDVKKAPLSRIARNLIRLFAAGFALAFLWSALNLIRSMTYNSGVEGHGLLTSVYLFVCKVQPIIFYFGIAIALIFLILLIFALTQAVLNRHHSRSSHATNV